MPTLETMLDNEFTELAIKICSGAKQACRFRVLVEFPGCRP
jgi:hypothetical protein